MSNTRYIAVMVFFFLLTPVLSAETRYVSDQLVITLRQQANNDSEIITTLRTDTPLEVLSDDGRYLLVRTENGEQGYVQSQYITKDTPKAILITRLERDKAQLQDKVSTLQKNRDALDAELNANKTEHRQNTQEGEQKISDLQKALDEAKKELEQVNKKYDTLLADSREVVNITNTRNQLEEDKTRLTEEIEALRQENKKLLTTGMIQWFLAGGGVFLVGWIIGKISRKKRRGF